VKATRAALQRAADTLDKYSTAAASAGEALAIISADIKQFLASDADELPPSLRQLGKLVRSQEMQDTLAACIASAVKGMLASGSPAADGAPGEPSVVDKVIEAGLSDRGQSLVGLAVRTAAQTSSETFCVALRTGIEAAMASSSSSSSGSHHQAEQHPDASPAASPQRYQQQHSPSRHRHQHLHGLHPAAATLVTVLSNPQVLNLIDALVSTTVGSAVGAYVRQAGQESMLTSFMEALAKPGNKEVIIEVMSSVSAAFCREAAAACVAPASTVASPRPASRLAQQSLPQPLLQQSIVAGSSSSSPLKQLQPSRKAAAAAGSDSEDADDEGSSSQPSTPQSGPSTPEPSIAAEPASVGGLRGLASRSSFAGSAVAGLILRRNSFPGMGGGWGVGSAGNSSGGGSVGCVVDPAALGPMSTLVSLFVQAARFQEFRSLIVDVTRSSTREFVLSLLPASWSLAARNGNGANNVLASAALTAALYRVYSAMCVVLFLMVYALGPKTLEQ
jgi:hypothetical protein